jgi:hypothetical protein
MNPTVVMVTISESEAGSQVTVRGAAKEGFSSSSGLARRQPNA